MDNPQRQIARAAGTVMAAFLLSNLVGLARQILISRAFGTGSDLDAFYVAQRLPDILFNLAAGGALASAFVPTFTGFLTRGDREAAWRLASSVMNLVFIVLCGAGLLAALLASPLVRYVLAPGFIAGEQQALTVAVLRILLIASVIFGVSGLLMGILNAHQHFILPALAPTFYWLGMIFGLLVWVPRMGIHGLAWGAVLGSALHLAIQLPGLRGLGARYWPGLGLRHPAVRDVIRLMGPRLIGAAAVQFNFLVSAALASFMLQGSVSALNYAWQIFTMPQIIIAQGISIAALPTFSAMVAREEINAMRASLADTLRGILFLALPATVGLLMLRVPVIALLFQRQSFDAESTALVAWALAWFTLGLASHSVVEIVSRAYYALRDTRTPVLVGVAAMGLNILLSFIFAWLFARLGWRPHGGLAFSNTVATTLEMIGLLWILRRRLGGLAFTRIWPGLWRTAFASLYMGLILMLWLRYTHGRSVWMVGVGGVLAGGLAFWLVAHSLRTPEARLLPALLRERLSLKTRSAPE
ncbi:MAG TPA: murein biosynthesis integral membrane protein MurJ [Anaerolineales bacterium]|nr:murein biosynthesis integral membrane protein MurJ [Anaerolineales bacterium]